MDDKTKVDYKGFLAGLPLTELLARTIDQEAANQSITGQAAVACVILNRANHPNPRRFGATVREVILRPKQFSCYNDGTKSLEAAVRTHASTKARTIAEMALTGLVDDPTHGCDHYCRFDVADRTAWTRHYKMVGRIGDHCFYDSKQKAVTV